MATRNERTIGVTEFKAKCLDVIDQLAARTLNRVVVTKRGRPVAVMEPPPEVQAQTAEERFDAIYGCIKDWPAPVPLEHEWEKPQYTARSWTAFSPRPSDRFMRCSIAPTPRTATGRNDPS